MADLPAQFTPRTPPMPHQDAALRLSWDVAGFALNMEQGTGKTWVALNTFAALCLSGVETLIVVAPGILLEQWAQEQIPTHGDPAWRVHIYKSASAKSRRAAVALNILEHHQGPTVLLISYDSLATVHGERAAMTLAQRRRTLLVADESTRVKTPGAVRTRALLRLARQCPYRRILSGTPISNGPFDLYSQMLVLDPDIWRREGLPTFFAFRHEFGVFRRIAVQGGRMVDVVAGYRRLDRLTALLDKHSYRVLKADVMADLPERSYEVREVELSPAQREATREIREELRLSLRNGEELAIPLVIVRLLRLQQVLCGHIPDPDFGDSRPIPGPLPRLNELLAVLEESGERTIVWARFRADMRLLAGALPHALVLDGSVAQADRSEVVRQFREDPDRRLLLANPAVAGEGLDLQCASRAIYWNNTFKLSEREQSEARCHRRGQRNAVTYVDLVARGDPLDGAILRALRAKREVAHNILDLAREVAR